MGTACTRVSKKQITLPSRVIIVKPKTQNEIPIESAHKIQKEEPQLENLPIIVKIESNMHDHRPTTSTQEEDVKTNHTILPTFLKFDIKELGIGEHYLEKELTELTMRNSANKDKSKKKQLKKHVKWDRAIVQMRMHLGNSLCEDDLYNFIDISLKEYSINKPQKYLKMLREELPMRYRWSVWKNSVDMNKFYVKNLYEKLKTLSTPCEKQIKMDIHRSFPEEPYFASSKFEHIGQEQLFNVLKCLSLYFPNIGYTQSMNFIAGFMLLVSGGNELEVFWMFVTLARDPKFMLMGLFEKDFPLLDFYIHAFYEILQKEMPAVHNHIKSQGLPDQLWLLKWFMTLFLYSLPTKYVLKVWDFLLEFGLLGMIKVSLGIINFIEKDLLTLDIIGMDALFQFLNAEKKLPNISVSAAHYENNENISYLHPLTAGHRTFTHTGSLQINANNVSVHPENPAQASVNNETSIIHFNFKELDIEYIINYAMKLEISNNKIGEIMKDFTEKYEKNLPAPYKSLLSDWEGMINSKERLDELQEDIDHHIVKTGLTEVNSGKREEIVITNLLVQEASPMLKDLDV